MQNFNILARFSRSAVRAEPYLDSYPKDKYSYKEANTIAIKF